MFFDVCQRKRLLNPVADGKMQWYNYLDCNDWKTYLSGQLSWCNIRTLILRRGFRAKFCREPSSPPTQFWYWYSNRLPAEAHNSAIWDNFFFCKIEKKLHIHSINWLGVSCKALNSFSLKSASTSLEKYYNKKKLPSNVSLQNIYVVYVC